METVNNLLGWAVAHPDEAAAVMALIGAALSTIQGWAVANQKSRLAALAGATSRSAGRVRLRLAAAAPGTNVEDLKRQLILDEALAQFTEFSKVKGATVAKVEGMIDGELGKLPVVPPVIAVDVASVVKGALPNVVPLAEHIASSSHPGAILR